MYAYSPSNLPVVVSSGSIPNRNNKKQYTNYNMLQQYCTKTSSLTPVKAIFLLSGKVLEILPRIEHVSIFPASYLPNHLEEPRCVVDDLNFLIVVKMLWTVEQTKPLIC